MHIIKKGDEKYFILTIFLKNIVENIFALVYHEVRIFAI